MSRVRSPPTRVGGAKKGGPRWDRSATKIAAEWLLSIGVLVCRERRGFQRVYDLAERAIPPDLLAREWTEEQGATRLGSETCHQRERVSPDLEWTMANDSAPLCAMPRTSTQTQSSAINRYMDAQSRSLKGLCNACTDCTFFVVICSPPCDVGVIPVPF